MELTTHGFRILDREAGVLCFEYSFAKQGTANTFIARMQDGKLLVVSPAARIGDAALAELATFGEVGAIVAPNGFHHLGLAQWRAKFPSARCFASPEAVARIKAKNPSAMGDFEAMDRLIPLVGAHIHIGEVRDTKCGETWVSVEVANGHVWFVSDTLANIPALPSNPIAKLLFRLSKSAPGYRVFNLAMTFIVKDKKATLRALGEEMKARPPTIVVPGHGAPLTDQDIAERTRALILSYVG